MKTKIYLRIARGGQAGFKVSASARPDHSPLVKGQYDKKPLPTVAFGVWLDIPDELFKTHERVIGTLELNERNTIIAAEMVTLDEASSNESVQLQGGV